MINRRTILIVSTLLSLANGSPRAERILQENGFQQELQDGDYYFSEQAGDVPTDNDNANETPSDNSTLTDNATIAENTDEYYYITPQVDKNDTNATEVTFDDGEAFSNETIVDQGNTTDVFVEDDPFFTEGNETMVNETAFEPMMNETTTNETTTFEPMTNETMANETVEWDFEDETPAPYLDNVTTDEWNYTTPSPSVEQEESNEYYDFNVTTAPSMAPTSHPVGGSGQHHGNETHKEGLNNEGGFSSGSASTVDRKRNGKVTFGLLLAFFCTFGILTFVFVKRNPDGLCATIVRCLGLVSWSVVSCPFRMCLRRRNENVDPGYYNSNERFSSMPRDLELT